MQGYVLCSYCLTVVLCILLYRLKKKHAHQLNVSNVCVNVKQNSLQTYNWRLCKHWTTPKHSSELSKQFFMQHGSTISQETVHPNCTRMRLATAGLAISKLKPKTKQKTVLHGLVEGPWRGRLWGTRFYWHMTTLLSRVSETDMWHDACSYWQQKAPQQAATFICSLRCTSIIYDENHKVLQEWTYRLSHTNNNNVLSAAALEAGAPEEKPTP